MLLISTSSNKVENKVLKLLVHKEVVLNLKQMYLTGTVMYMNHDDTSLILRTVTIFTDFINFLTCQP